MTEPRNPLEVVEEALERIGKGMPCACYIEDDFLGDGPPVHHRCFGCEVRSALALVRKMRADAVVGTHHDALVEALREIAKAEGPYARDRLQHAENTVESMVAIAEAALASLTDEEPTDAQD
jgi:hypothetical protein